MTVRADLTSGDIESFLTEHEAGEDVDDAEDRGQDAGRDDEGPVVAAEGLFRGGGFVEVAEHGASEDEHEDAEGDEARGGGEERPVFGDVAAEETDFGDY